MKPEFKLRRFDAKQVRITTVDELVKSIDAQYRYHISQQREAFEGIIDSLRVKCNEQHIDIEKLNANMLKLMDENEELRKFNKTFRAPPNLEKKGSLWNRLFG